MFVRLLRFQDKRLKGGRCRIKESAREREREKNEQLELPKPRPAPAAAAGSKGHRLPGKFGKFADGGICATGGGAGHLPILYKIGERLTCPSHVST